LLSNTNIGLNINKFKSFQSFPDSFSIDFFKFNQTFNSTFFKKSDNYKNLDNVYVIDEKNGNPIKYKNKLEEVK
jgi:hypothetical protein